MRVENIIHERKAVHTKETNKERREERKKE